ncbi:hypothetical protein SMETH2_19740 [Serratia marcescens]|nr:hypothetical protein SMETH2_19740 [Serratia marcescens]
MHLGIEDVKLSKIAKRLNVPRATLHSMVERQGLLEAIHHYATNKK